MKQPIILDSNIIIYSIAPDYQFLQDYLAEYKLYASAISKVEVLGFSRLSTLDKSDFIRYFQKIILFKITDEVLEQAITIRQQKKMSLGDSTIAGTALVYNLPIMTRNVADFEWIEGLEVVNPFN